MGKNRQKSPKPSKIHLANVKKNEGKQVHIIILFYRIVIEKYLQKPGQVGYWLNLIGKKVEVSLQLFDIFNRVFIFLWGNLGS